jgi:hypothetical protein
VYKAIDLLLQQLLFEFVLKKITSKCLYEMVVNCIKSEWRMSHSSIIAKKSMLDEYNPI